MALVLSMMLQGVLSGCVDRPLDPTIDRTVSLQIHPVFGPEVGTAVSGETVDAVRVVVVRPPSEIVADEVVARSPNEQSVSIEVRVALRGWVETLEVGVELLAGELVLFSGTQTVEVRAGSQRKEFLEVHLSYVGPRPSISPNTLEYSAEEGTDPPTQTFDLTNAGGGTLSWMGSSEAPWLTFSPASGVLESSQTQTVAVEVRAAQLPLGVHAATILIVDTNLGTADSVTVRLEVARRPEIGLSPGSLLFWTQEDSDPESSSFAVTNEGGGTLSWAIESDAEWIVLTPGSGALAPGQEATVVVSPEAATLPPGTYRTTISVRDPVAINSPQTLPLTLVVTRKAAISILPSALRFVSQGGSNPPDQSFVLANGGGGVLRWEVSDDSDWLAVTPTSGSLEPGEAASVSVSVDGSELSPGAHSGVISVSDPEASNSPRTVSVEVNVKPDPEIGLSNQSLSFTARLGINPPARFEVLTNSGGGMLSWQVTDDVGWLSVSPGSGELGEGEFQDLLFDVQSQALGTGTYSANVTITDAGASNSPQVVSVSLEVLPEPGPLIGLSRGSMAFSAEKGANPPSQSFTIGNDGGQTLSWTASDDAPWLEVVPASGNLGSGQGTSVDVDVASEILEPGVYQATISIEDPGAENTPQLVSVALEVKPGPAIGVDQSVLSFTAHTGTDPPGQTLSFRNAGGGILRWEARDVFDCQGSDCPFAVAVTPGSGTLGSGESASVSVAVSSAQTDPGTYRTTAWVEITDPEASNSPQTVPIELTVADPVPPTIFDISAALVEVKSPSCSYMNPLGSLFEIRFRFHDDNGDVDQESGRLTVQYQYEGAPTYEFSQPPQGGLTIKGNGFDGTVTSTQCHRFGSFSNWVKLTHSLSDAEGLRSNPLLVTVPKPEGANAPPSATSNSGGAAKGGG